MSEAPRDPPTGPEPSHESAQSADVGDRSSGAAQPRRAARRFPATRTSGAFKSLLAGAIVLVLLLVFILENTQSVKISYFGATGHLALGVALLLAAVGGALLAGVLGAARIAQLRRHARRPR
jgi:uncharacterized integral membrane protein